MSSKKPKFSLESLWVVRKTGCATGYGKTIKLADRNFKERVESAKEKKSSANYLFRIGQLESDAVMLKSRNHNLEDRVKELSKKLHDAAVGVLYWRDAYANKKIEAPSVNLTTIQFILLGMVMLDSKDPYKTAVDLNIADVISARQIEAFISQWIAREAISANSPSKETA